MRYPQWLKAHVRRKWDKLSARFAVKTASVPQFANKTSLRILPTRYAQHAILFVVDVLSLLIRNRLLVCWLLALFVLVSQTLLYTTVRSMVTAHANQVTTTIQ
jgi:hypothetical protein